MFKNIVFILLIFLFIYFVKLESNFDIFVFFRINGGEESNNIYCNFIQKYNMKIYNNTILNNMDEYNYIKLLFNLDLHKLYFPPYNKKFIPFNIIKNDINTKQKHVDAFDKYKCVYEFNKNDKINLPKGSKSDKEIEKIENIDFTKIKSLSQNEIKNLIEKLINYALIYKLPSEKIIVFFEIYEKLKEKLKIISYAKNSISESEIEFLFLFLTTQQENKLFSKNNLQKFYKLFDVDIDNYYPYTLYFFYKKIVMQSFLFLIEQKNNNDLLINIFNFLQKTYNANSNSICNGCDVHILNKILQNFSDGLETNDIILKEFLKFLNTYNRFNNNVIYDIFLKYVTLKKQKQQKLDIDIVLGFFKNLNSYRHDETNINILWNFHNQDGLDFFMELLSLEEIQNNESLLCEIFYFINNKFEQRYKIYLKHNFLNEKKLKFNINGLRCYTSSVYDLLYKLNN